MDLARRVMPTICQEINSLQWRGFSKIALSK